MHRDYVAPIVGSDYPTGCTFQIGEDGNPDPTTYHPVRFRQCTANLALDALIAAEHHLHAQRGQDSRWHLGPTRASCSGHPQTRLHGYQQSLYGIQVHHNIDHLFGAPQLSAVAYHRRPKTFHSSVMVVEPTAAHNTFRKLQKLARNCVDSFDFSSCADQILNRHFKRWHKLPQTYCSEVSSSFAYVPPGGDANTLSPEIRVSWFSGNTWKPWMLAVCEKKRKVLCMGGGQVIPHLEN
ncbi:PREDICTED: uncharacterized protein LOC106809215 [Priapulus caudatus]|uniref:Uncharacterized protein LOC106809215 n=1 Tax=Priapulus caudatus TaxID=37621 RepID=A0ABM1E677_PRICU|nr:PREDICTED: uncharacterized protein LOC106809215 [Priapulus caudatus]